MVLLASELFPSSNPPFTVPSPGRESRGDATQEPQDLERCARLWLELGMHPHWVPVLTSQAAALRQLHAALLAREAAGEEILPPAHLIFRPLTLAPEQVKILIVGQDPYPTPGHGVGLSFSVDPAVRPLPRSLVNIRQELHDDVGLELPEHGSLDAWQQQGVMLLNRSLTVTAGKAGSHARDGWAAITNAVVAHLGTLPGAPVAILWGKHAQQLAPLLDGHPLIESAHPSPLSARRGFFGSRPFSRANAALAALGQEPVNWTLPA